MDRDTNKTKEELHIDSFENVEEGNSQTTEKFFKRNFTKFWIPYIGLNTTKKEIQIFERFGHNPPTRPLKKLVIDDKGSWYGCEISDTETQESKTIEFILDKKKFLNLIH